MSSPCYFFFGTFAPFLRAFESPMAIACLRLLILCFPDRLWCISVRTSELAFLLYLRRDFFLAGILSPYSMRRMLAGARLRLRKRQRRPPSASESFCVLQHQSIV